MPIDTGVPIDERVIKDKDGWVTHFQCLNCGRMIEVLKCCEDPECKEDMRKQVAEWVKNNPPDYIIE
jgi:hypothetical protein